VLYPALVRHEQPPVRYTGDEETCVAPLAEAVA
jgi:hypothetical protein